ncbi:hypothetical protein ACTHQ1_14540 [Janibacter anophelis]|uniref:hypothetical protein n=1 Tax=Janibacter anophelis TaxID=319054 RepID=UPI003F7DE59A
MKTTTLALALSAVLALSACAQTSGTTQDSPSSGTNRPSASTDAADAPMDDTTAEPADATDLPEDAEEGMPVQSFGEAFTYVDGIQITVSAPAPMTSSQWASPGNTKGSSFTVTIVNGSDVPFDPSMANVTAQSANSEAEQIFDSENGYGGSPDTTLLPGREAKYTVAFATTDPKDVVVEASPSWDHVAALYASDGAS